MNIFFNSNDATRKFENSFDWISEIFNCNLNLIIFQK